MTGHFKRHRHGDLTLEKMYIDDASALKMSTQVDFGSGAIIPICLNGQFF